MLFVVELFPIASLAQTPVLAKKYRGSFKAITEYSEALNIPANQTTDFYKLTIKNSNGVSFIPKVCTGNFIQKLICGLTNTINNIAVNVTRVDWAKVVINNVEVVNSSQINKTNLYYETVLKLSQVNQLKISVKGSIASYVDLELKYLGEAIDKTPPVILANVTSGSLTNINKIHVSITDKSNITTEVYKEGSLIETNTLKEFDLTLSEGSNNFILKSKDSLNNVATDYAISNVVLDTLPPTLVSDSSPSYTVDNLPTTINVHFTSNEELSSVEIDGQTIVLLNPLAFVYSKTVNASGDYSINLKIKDKAGNETNKIINYSVEESFSLAIISPLKDEVLPSGIVDINIKSNKEMDAFYINGKAVPLLEDRMSVTRQIKVPIHGKFKIQARGISGALEKTKEITFEVGQNTIAPWVYEECPSP